MRKRKKVLIGGFYLKGVKYELMCLALQRRTTVTQIIGELLLEGLEANGEKVPEAVAAPFRRKVKKKVTV